MARSFEILRAGMSPKQRAQAARLARKMAREISLTRLRAARRLSQEQIAATLETRQSSVSRLERRGDMRVSTLRGYVEALGGRLEISARFPDGSVSVIRLAPPAR